MRGEGAASSAEATRLRHAVAGGPRDVAQLVDTIDDREQVHIALHIHSSSHQLGARCHSHTTLTGSRHSMGRSRAGCVCMHACTERSKAVGWESANMLPDRAKPVDMCKKS